jgi:N-acetylneuraminate synthase
MGRNTLENFLTPILDSWSKYTAEKLVILGNGESRPRGLEFARQESLPVVSINNIDDESPVIFTIVTRLGLLPQLESQNTKGIPLIIPSGFPSSTHSVPLPISEFEYIEGLSVNESSRVGFREDFVLITILDLLNLLATHRESLNGPVEVHLFGFDFQITPNNDTKIEDLFLESLLVRQKSIFEMLLRQDKPFENLTLVNNSVVAARTNEISAKEINKSVPQVSGAALKAAISKNIELQQQMFRRASDGEVQIIAELTNNHLGDTDRLTAMVRLCKSQGASVIKIQKRDINVLYTQEERESGYSSPFGTTLGEYRAGVELSMEQIEFLTVLCAELEIPWFTSVLDLPSLELISRFEPLSIKVPSTISEHKNFLRKIANSNVEYIFISTGATDQSFLDWVAENFAEKKIILMQCTSSYPTAPDDCNVAVVKTIQKMSEGNMIIPGYSSHDIGSLACQLSVANGARFIEKHMKFGSVEWVHFDGVALDLTSNDLSNFVKDIRVAERILGSEEKKQLVSEHHKYKPNSKHN